MTTMPVRSLGSRKTFVMQAVLMIAFSAFALPTAAHALTGVASVRHTTIPGGHAKKTPYHSVQTEGTQVHYQGPDSPAVDDLREVLKDYDAGEIELQKVPLGSRTGQEFYLERKHQKVRIRYTTNNSLENALYTLLDRWGFHWYGPGENWFVKPAAIPNEDIAGHWIAPTFRNRSFFGTGGLDLPVPGDPANQYKARWYAWKRRNRFNADFLPAGHTGMAFYQENKALLDSHPEWFNSDSGRQFGRFRIEIRSKSVV